MKNSKHHIIVGMSGGVDSSVAAYLLKKAGHFVEGVFMKNWEEDDKDDYCPASIDMADADAVCQQLQIELHRVNFAAEYWERVFSHFLKEYQQGRTPNPDILCNKEIKFKAFLAYAKQRGADFIATGHYAQCIHGSRTHLLKGVDHGKDQSYFLHALSEEQLAESLFPLGAMTKETVRNLAKELGFVNHNKKDSTGICFIGERKFKTFLNDYLPAQPGNMKTPEGKIVGQHDGLMFYTIGQRQGLNIGGLKGSPEAPWYVLQKNIKDNELIVGQGENHPLLYSQQLVAENLHWIRPDFTPPHQLFAKTRYRQKDQACMIKPITNNQYLVTFDEAQRAITPGQYIVFYENDECLGGGVIVKTDTSIEG